MKTRILLSAAAVLLLAFVQISCGSDSKPPVAAANPTTPKFLMAVDGNNGMGGNNVNVFPVNSTTGALGAPVSGSPFNMGLTDGMTLAVHPNGRFVYAADGVDGSIHSWSVNETTGVPTQIAAPVINESGSFFEPCCAAEDADTHVLTITPNGNFLFSSNNDATVGAYKINTDGSLAHVADVNLAGACDTGGIDANDSFVWVTDSCNFNNGTGPWNVWTMSIGATGALTNANSAALSGVDGWLWSVQVNPVSNFVYVGDEGGGAQLYSFSMLPATGALTQLGPQLVELNSSDVRDIAHSPDGKFFYTSDDDTVVHAFSVDTTTGVIAELAGSPYIGGAGQIVADVTGKFVYVGDNEDTGQVIGYTRDATTGALTLIGNTTTADASARAIGIIR
jgi:6-phosphogluconolactonase (cycloisomerase 2 family)